MGEDAVDGGGEDVFLEGEGFGGEAFDFVFVGEGEGVIILCAGLLRFARNDGRRCIAELVLGAPRL